MSDDRSSVPVRVELGASAKAEFKAEIKAEVPSSAVGGFVEALTDAIRPFTEARGMRADQIRLQREDVLIQIAKKAKERIQIEQGVVSPISNRVLIPFLERASWTDPADEVLVQAWADLLASASVCPSPNHALSVDILSKLAPEHVRFLNWLSKNGSKGSYRDAFLNVSEQSVRLQLSEIGSEFGTTKKKVGDEGWLDDLVARVSDIFDIEGVCFTGGVISLSSKYGLGDYYEFGSGLSDAKVDQSVAEALASISIVADVFIELVELFDGCEVWVHFYCLTNFGGEFVKDCTGGQLR